MRGVGIRELSSPTWQPIETAPKDGTDIILGAPAQTYNGQPVAPRSTVGHWTTEEECREQIGDCGGECRCPEYTYHDPYWMTWDGGFTEENPPTHWMPLPPPPQVLENQSLGLADAHSKNPLEAE
jgi:hypothetical protein